MSEELRWLQTATPEEIGRLTPREREIYQMRLNGLSKRQVAEALRIGFRTVESHLEDMTRRAPRPEDNDR